MKGMIAGVDEVGRGPLAGPVVAAAVVLDPANQISGLKDSKKLSEKRRDALYFEIKEKAFGYALGRAEVSEIDEFNILNASLLAMKRAIEGLNVPFKVALIDGNKSPKVSCVTKTIIGGDSLIQEISAASILAKVTRDTEMKKMDLLYPEYGFSSHKGYPTKAHIKNLNKFGVLDIHRRSFAPVRNLLVPKV